jgi:replication factor C subunit 1
MISGPPGIGKSSMVRIISKELGFGLIEINASDKRSKTVIENMLKDLSESSTMTYYMENLDTKECKKGKNRKTVIVMDEVDGCSSSDKGGISALI